MSPFWSDPTALVLLIPGIAIAVLAALPGNRASALKGNRASALEGHRASALEGYRVSALVNSAVSAATLAAALSLLWVRPETGLFVFVDDLNVAFIAINAFVGFT